MDNWNWVGTLIIALDALLVIGVALRVMLTRHPPGSSFAWILVTLAVPFGGFVLYLLVGERPIGRSRHQRVLEYTRHFRGWLLPGHQAPHPATAASRDFDAMAAMATRLTHLPPCAGNTLTLMSDTRAILRALARDIAAAHERVDLAFYIWNAGGAADEVEAALIAAAARGVVCRVLLDAMGSKAYLAGGGAARLRKTGIRVEAAMMVRAWQMPFVRADLRLHRKIALIDNRAGYTGSLNLLDPRYFKQNAGVGEWVDAMVRIEGPALDALRTVFAYDWILQTGEPPAQESATLALPALPPSVVQVVPSGPGVDKGVNLRLILEAVNRAHTRLLLTTPYFVPGDALSLALQNAALRGVEVRLLLPEKNDSRLVQYASRWYFDDLLAAGVHIMQYRGGLLHTKSITVDDTLSLFGTVNLDMRSLHLNFELMLLVLDARFTHDLIALQQSYEQDALAVEAGLWQRRGLAARLKEGMANLVSPLL
ncbi:cardiolipin synthase [Craterilacuibacter sp.]|uniref:cardiolipin synthase n=1 Tax=Craterilacuibacter sp. TaxID=2870909 RepID=UPI003F2FD4AC